MTSSCLLADCPAVDGINISRPCGEQSETWLTNYGQHLAVATFAVSDRNSGMRPSMLGFPQEATSQPFWRWSALGSNPDFLLGGPHVRFRRVQTLVREGSPLVKLRNSA